VFPKLPVGKYELLLQIDGFKPHRRTGLTVDADGALQVNATLEVGGQSETVTVTANQLRVDTVSTQLGEVVSVSTMTTLSLNFRSYTDLLAIQPGVIPTTTIQSNSVIMAGVTGTVAPSGELNAGNVSVSGQRETANGFFVNGGDVQEHMNGGTSVVPNLDSIEEFRVLTNNFDPQWQLQRWHRQRGPRSGAITSREPSNSSNTALMRGTATSPERAQSSRTSRAARSAAPSGREDSSSSGTIRRPGRRRGSKPD
jgi:hypothetical protein